jgi:hypothetical protein
VIGFPGVAEQQRSLRFDLFAEVAEVSATGQASREAFMVERLARAQIDGTRDAALDHVRRGILVHVDTGHELGRHVLETQAARVARAEDVATVELAAHLGEAPHGDAAALRREAIGIAGREQVVDRHAGDSLQGLRHTAIRQRADVDRADRIDDDLGVLLYLLRSLDALAQARDHDLGELRVLSGRLRETRGGRQQRSERDRRSAEQ